MSLGLRMYDIIYDMRIYESIEHLSHIYFHFSRRKTLKDLLETMKQTPDFQLLKQYYERDKADSIAGRALVQSMFEKLTASDREGCVVPLLLLYLVDNSIERISNLSARHLADQLLEDTKAWVKVGLKNGWISEDQHNELVLQGITGMKEKVIT